MIDATLAETTDPAQRAALEQLRIEKQKSVSEMATKLANSPYVAPATPSVCPACNAPASGKFCEFCGEKLG